MDEKKKFKLKRVDVLLLILLALLIWLAIGFVQFSKETEQAKKEYDALHSPLTGTETISRPFATEAPERVVLEQVPEYLLNRGIVLRGKLNQDNSGFSYRESASGKQSMFGSRWWADYLCDCNVSVESDSHDLIRFCDRFYSGKDPFQYNFRGDELFDVSVKNDAYNISIFRSYVTNEDCTGGAVWIEDDPGYYEPIFYDPTGRFIMMTGGDPRPQEEEWMLLFLEPVMKKVEINVMYSEDAENLISADPGVIQQYVDAMHEMEFTLTDKDPDSVLNSARVACLSFTAENGVVHEYYFTAEGYMVNEDQVYEIGETEITIPLTQNPVKDDGKLEDDIIYIDAP